MRQALPFLLLILAGLACKAPAPQPKSAGIGPFADLRKLRGDIEASIKVKKKWFGVDVTKLEDNAITLHLNYKGMPGSMAEVKADTDGIAQTVLQLLSKQGYNSKDRMLQLFVHAQRPENGATGSPVVRRFGKTMYDFSNDSLAFSEAGSFY